MIVTMHHCKTNDPITFLRDTHATVTYTMNLTGLALDHVDSAVRTSVANAAAVNYRSKHALAVTWNQLSFYGGHPGYKPYPVSNTGT